MCHARWKVTAPLQTATARTGGRRSTPRSTYGDRADSPGTPSGTRSESRSLGQTLTGPDEPHECVFQTALARLCTQLLRCSAGDHGSVCYHDHVIAERSHLLHDMTGKQYTVTFIAQPYQQAAQ